MTTVQRFFFAVFCLAGVGSHAASYDFTSGDPSTNGWQPYAPLAAQGVTTTFSESEFYGYRFQSDPSPSPGQFGNARLGSFLPGSFDYFSITYDIAPSNSWPQEFVGAAARVGTLGPDTTSGYVFGYDKNAGTVYISKLVGDTLQAPLSASVPVTILFGAIGYELTFQGSGDNLQGAIYKWGDASPLATVSVTDSSFASGEVGLVAVSQTAGEGVDATFRDFSVVPEPTTAALSALGALVACGARIRRRPGR
jgi:hypothetical protein